MSIILSNSSLSKKSIRILPLPFASSLIDTFVPKIEANESSTTGGAEGTTWPRTY